MPSRKLEVLQDRAEPRCFEEVQLAVLQELGAPIEDLFAKFEPEARAAASLAQVPLIFFHSPSNVLALRQSCVPLLKTITELGMLCRSSTFKQERPKLVPASQSSGASCPGAQGQAAGWPRGCSQGPVCGPGDCSDCRLHHPLRPGQSGRPVVPRQL